MNRGPLFWLLVAGFLVAVIVGVNLVSNLKESRRYCMTIATYSAGHELIETTNAPQWVQADSELHKDMADLLASPTYINKVLIGDEITNGKGKASSRLVLTNEQGHGLVLRLRLQNGDKHSQFEVLSHMKITNAACPKANLCCWEKAEIPLTPTPLPRGEGSFAAPFGECLPNADWISLSPWEVRV